MKEAAEIVLRKDIFSKRQKLKPGETTHGMSRTPEYGSWNNMMSRCYSPSFTRYEKWGGRGIRVCERWWKFENFLSDMGPKPSASHSIERRDNDKDYCPDNCKWATKKEQSRNTANCHYLTVGGVTRCIREWSEISGMHENTIRYRIKIAKLSPEEAVRSGRMQLRA